MGHGLALLLLDAEKCWAAPNFRNKLKMSVLEVLQEHNCPQSHVPKAASCPRCGWRGLRTPLGSLLSAPSKVCGIWHLCCPHPSIAHPAVSGAGAGGTGSPPSLTHKDFPLRRSGS